MTNESIGPRVSSPVAANPWVSVILSLIVLLTAINTTVQVVAPIWLNSHQEARSRETSVKVAEVKRTLETSNEATDDKLKNLAIVAHSTHLLVNSNLNAQLKISAVALRRLAIISKDADDIAAAELAEKLLHEHEAKQKQVDAIPPK